MKVYIIMSENDYSDPFVEQVFDSKEKAIKNLEKRGWLYDETNNKFIKKNIENDEDEWTPYEGVIDTDRVFIFEWEVNGILTDILGMTKQQKEMLTLTYGI